MSKPRVSKPVSPELCISGPKELVESKSAPELIEAFKAACLKAAEGIAEMNKEIGHIEPTDVLFNALKEREEELFHARRRVAELGADAEQWRSEASKWADCAVNGLQWLRNVEARISNPDYARERYETEFNACRETIAAQRESRVKI